MSKTISFIAHQDDDLLFMNPDIASDVQAGWEVWIVYLTAGEVGYKPGRTHWGMDYADLRIQGARAAYARAAKVANSWEYEPRTFAGRQLATNRLNGTNVHLVFTFIHAAEGADNGDLYRMLHNSSFVAKPIDGRPGYTKSQFQAMLKSIITTVNPDFIRTQSTIGHREIDSNGNPDHIDHISGAILTANAAVNSEKKTLVRRDEYQNYIIAEYEENVWGYWRDEKSAIWDQYWPKDPELQPWSWQNVMGRQYRPEGRIFFPGTPWVPPGDF
ncbi:PIG-L family deacetylase [Amycolatopsis sp. NPDC059657]|uniref:PIG-L family deacetylase n=1 Tax=Amycolatopsis sp. NPDC059657 TaxID=3346899 RepID=UPI0036727DF8